MTRAKQQIGRLIREVGSVFTVAAAANCLGKSSTSTAKILARWAKQGWLTRLKRGLYAVVPIDASSSDQALDDAWILIPKLFESSYIGGWSAAEYWNLTEQIFRDICVLTESTPAKKLQRVHNATFVVTKISPQMNFGTKTIWKNNSSLQISDSHKTILDMLYHPGLGGGIQHVVECFAEYERSEHVDFSKLGEYALRMQNGAIFKRLGFLAERRLGREHTLTNLCSENLSQGNAFFDPALKNGPLITRWRLFVPESFQEEK